MNEKQKKAIVALATNSSTARAVFRNFRERQREWSHHSADRLLKFAMEYAREDEEQPTYEGIIEMLKELDRLELGVYKIGRKGHKTRIEWLEGTSIKAIGEVAVEADIADAGEDTLAGDIGSDGSREERSKLLNETVVILEAALTRLRRLQRMGVEVDIEGLLEAAQ
jgi:hypothetical protein